MYLHTANIKKTSVSREKIKQNYIIYEIFLVTFTVFQVRHSFKIVAQFPVGKHLICSSKTFNILILLPVFWFKPTATNTYFLYLFITWLLLIYNLLPTRPQPFFYIFVFKIITFKKLQFLFACFVWKHTSSGQIYSLVDIYIYIDKII